MMSPVRGVAAVARALGAAALLAALVVGVPFMLWRWGVTPTTWPSLEQTRQALLSPDDGTLLYGVLTLIGWGVWLALLVALGLEAEGMVRRRAARRRRGMGGMQAAAAWLLGSLVVLSAPSVASAATPSAAPAATASPSPSDSSERSGPAERTQQPRPAASDSVGEEPVHRVSDDNPTLWGIAEAELGDGSRWRDIRALNPEVGAGDLPEGLVLKMPADAARSSAPAGPGTDSPQEADAGPQANSDAGSPTSTTSTSAGGNKGGGGSAETYTVQEGDTLWGVADSELDDPGKWPQLAEANPQVSDPDVIYPGQRLSLPGQQQPSERPGQGTQRPDTDTGDRPDDDQGGAGEDRQDEEKDSSSPSPAPPADEQPEQQPHEEGERGSETAAPSDQGGQDGASVAAEWGLPSTQQLLGVAGGVLTAGVVTTLAVRRAVQQRRRRRGRRIPLPQGRAAGTEQDLREAVPPVEPAILGTVLRSMAVSLRAAGLEMPRLRAVVLGPETVHLHLVEPAGPASEPFTVEAEGGRWVCALDAPQLREAAQWDDVEAPYPGLVVLGALEDGRLVLVDVEEVGLVRLTGPSRQAVARSLAVELAVSQLADAVSVRLTESIAPGLAAWSDRVTSDEDGSDLLRDLHVHHAEQQRALQVVGADSLQQARLGETGAGEWTPYVVVGACDPEQVWQIVGSTPRTAAAVICCADTDDHEVDDGDGVDDAAGSDTQGWRLHVAVDAPTPIPGTDLECWPQALSDDAYDDILQLLETAADEQPSPDPAAVEAPPSPAVLAPAPTRESTSGEPQRDGEPTVWDDEETSEENTDASGTGAAGVGVSLLADLAGLDEPEPAETVDEDAPPVELSKDPAPSGDSPTPASDPPAPAAHSDHGEEAVAQEAPAKTPEPASESASSVPYVRVLGTVEVQGAAGTLEVKRMRVATELVTWLLLHPGSDRAALQHALWRGRSVKAKTVTELISRTRTWLGTTPDGSYYLPIISERDDARYALSEQVTSDWHQFQQLVAKGQHTSGASGARLLRQALELVSGTPFSGVPPHRYAWAEPLIQDMISAIVDTAELLGERQLVAGAPREALWAATTGLTAAPEAEQLYRIKFQALHAIGDLEGVQRAADELDVLCDELGTEAEDATMDLLHSLLSGASR